jgi:hypothetical protein
MTVVRRRPLAATVSKAVVSKAVVSAPGAGGSVIVTGFTTGAPVNGTAPGNGDVFLATVDPAEGTP